GQLPRWNRPIHKNQFVFESVGIKAFESSQCDCLAPLRCPRLFSLLEPRLVLTDTCGEVRALDLDDENATAAHRMPRPCALADEEVRRVAVPAPVLAAVVDVEVSLRWVGNTTSEIDVLDLGGLEVQLLQDLLI